MVKRTGERDEDASASRKRSKTGASKRTLPHMVACPSWMEKWNSLPKGLQRFIINKLPMPEVFGLSCVCKDFSDGWRGLRNLDFGKDTMEAIENSRQNFAHITTRILSGLSGPVDKFSIYISGNDVRTSLVAQWIEFLSENRIKELSIESGSGIGFRLPSNLWRCNTTLQQLCLSNCQFVGWASDNYTAFVNLLSLNLSNTLIPPDLLMNIISGSRLLKKVRVSWERSENPVVIKDELLRTLCSRSLTYLHLANCWLSTSCEFQGFAELEYLRLHCVAISPILLTRIITTSPLLKELYLYLQNSQEGPLIINAPLLKTLHLEAPHWHLSLTGECRNLTNAHIDTALEIPAILPGDSKLALFVNLFPNIQILTLSGIFLEVLSEANASTSFTRPPVCLPNLTHLEVIRFETNCVAQLACAWSLIRHSPNIKSLELCLWFEYDTNTNIEAAVIEFHEMEGSDKISHSLSTLKFTEAWGTESNSLFLQNMLKCCPALQTIYISMDRSAQVQTRDEEIEFFQKVLGYQRPESAVIKFMPACSGSYRIFNRSYGGWYWKPA